MSDSRPLLLIASNESLMREQLQLSLSSRYRVLAVCPDCGRHRELCMLEPCNRPPAHPTPARAPRGLVVRMQRRQVSGAERVRAVHLEITRVR